MINWLSRTNERPSRPATQGVRGRGGQDLSPQAASHTSRHELIHQLRLAFQRIDRGDIAKDLADLPGASQRILVDTILAFVG